MSSLAESPSWLAPGRATDERLELPPSAVADLERRGAKGFPYEVCGLLLGTRQGSVWRVELVTQGQNLSEDRQSDRFILDPAHYLEADKLASQKGFEVIGVWHTHPDHPAVPSITDFENAWAGFAYLIVPTTAQGAGQGRTYVLQGERFAEISMEIAA